jgi:hypothetical protein
MLELNLVLVADADTVVVLLNLPMLRRLRS